MYQSRVLCQAFIQKIVLWQKKYFSCVVREGSHKRSLLRPREIMTMRRRTMAFQRRMVAWWSLEGWQLATPSTNKCLRDARSMWLSPLCRTYSNGLNRPSSLIGLTTRLASNSHVDIRSSSTPSMAQSISPKCWCMEAFASTSCMQRRWMQ